MDAPRSKLEAPVGDRCRVDVSAAARGGVVGNVGTEEPSWLVRPAAEVMIRRESDQVLFVDKL
jgi:hypothetical protein